MKSLLLIGGGGHCKSCIDVINHLNEYQIKGIVEKEESCNNGPITKNEVIGYDYDLPRLIEEYKNALVNVGQIKNSNIRKKLYTKLKNLNAGLPIIISPTAYVSKNSEINNGTIIMHNAIVNTDAVIGENCIVNNMALIEHDVNIDSHCHISTGSRINGGVRIESEVFIGSGAVILEEIRIGKGSVIGAGTTVTKDIPEGSLFIGKHE